ncbi:MAG: hypothetical protein ACRD2W_07370 [Acidimicrobiales bacterium]
MPRSLTAPQVGRHQAKALVLTGTATLFRVRVLRELVSDGSLPVSAQSG